MGCGTSSLSHCRAMALRACALTARWTRARPWMTSPNRTWPAEAATRHLWQSPSRGHLHSLPSSTRSSTRPRQTGSSAPSQTAPHATRTAMRRRRPQTRTCTRTRSRTPWRARYPLQPRAALLDTACPRSSCRCPSRSTPSWPQRSRRRCHASCCAASTQSPWASRCSTRTVPPPTWPRPTLSSRSRLSPRPRKTSPQSACRSLQVRAR
mmetsp:Transcript_22895/g.62126  ORF Transcript_22895/g.62126 Transcript_22895/m.62126 type:complete len:209 (+) Transcript_22895:456-1082(+)